MYSSLADTFTFAASTTCVYTSRAVIRVVRVTHNTRDTKVVYAYFRGVQRTQLRESFQATCLPHQAMANSKHENLQEQA